MNDTRAAPAGGNARDIPLRPASWSFLSEASTNPTPWAVRYLAYPLITVFVLVCWTLLTLRVDDLATALLLAPVLFFSTGTAWQALENRWPFFPASPTPFRTVLSRGLVIGLVASLCGALLLPCLLGLWFHAAVGWPVFWPVSWSNWAQGLLAALLIDAGQYLLHRHAHVSRFPIFWRIHMMHHATEVLQADEGKNISIAETLYIHCPTILLMAAVLGAPTLPVVYGFLLYSLLGSGNHANIDIRTGPLRYLFVTPELHRWHHVADIPAAGNFAFCFAPLDLLGGTRSYGGPYPGWIGIAGLDRLPVRLRDRWRLRWNERLPGAAGAASNDTTAT